MRNRLSIKYPLLVGLFFEQLTTSYLALVNSSTDYFYHSVIGEALLKGKVFWNPMYHHREVYYDILGKFIFALTGKHLFLASLLSAIIMVLTLWFALKVIEEKPLFYVTSLLLVGMYVIGNLGPRTVQFSFLLYSYLFYQGIQQDDLNSWEWFSKLFLGTLLIALFHGSYQLVPVMLCFIILLRKEAGIDEFMLGLGAIAIAVAVYLLFMLSQGMSLKEFLNVFGYASRYGGVITEWSSMFNMFNALPLAILVSYIFLYALSDDRKDLRETIVFSLIILFSVNIQRIFLFFLPVISYITAKRNINAISARNLKLDPIGAAFSTFILPFGIVALAGLPKGNRIDNNIKKIQGKVVFIHPADGIKAYFYNHTIEPVSAGDYKLYEDILKYTKGNKISSQELFFFDRSNAVYKFFLGKGCVNYYLGVTPLTEAHYLYIMMWLIHNNLLKLEQARQIRSIRVGDYTFFFWEKNS